MFKMCLTFSGNVFGHFEKKMKVFPFFLSFSKFRPSRVHWALFFREKTSKQVQNLFGHFWKRVWVSWILRSFCISLKFFEVSTLQGALAKKSRKNHIKTCLDNLGNVFGHFWKFEFFSISVELFRVSRVHWAEFFSVEIFMQNMIKQCFWERFWRILKVSKFFHFFVFFASFDHPGCTGQKIFSEKYLKTSLKLVWKLLRTFLDTFRNSNFFDFFSNFWSPGCTGREKFEKSHLKTNLDTFGNVFRDFENLIFFPFFWNFSTSRPSRVHWTKNFDKITSKHVWTL